LLAYIKEGSVIKTLYIIRHAKSSWKDLALDDFERPLNKRGKRDAPVMGERLAKNQVMPDIILSSPAKRAKMSAKIIANKVHYDKKIIFKQEIYEADQQTLQKIVNNIDDRYDTAFLVGHNPGLNELAEYYVNYEENLPTCGIIGIAFTCNHWKESNAENARLLSVDYPKK